MVKLFKMMKKSDNLQKTINTGMMISSGIDRLIMLLFGIFFMTHLLACLWIIIGTEELNSSKDGWLGHGSLNDDGASRTYMTAFYFIITTMTTVGYGDMSAGTPIE